MALVSTPTSTGRLPVESQTRGDAKTKHSRAEPKAEEPAPATPAETQSKRLCAFLQRPNNPCSDKKQSHHLRRPYPPQSR